MAIRILTVCTANICRSPTAARGLRAGLDAISIPGDPIVVESVGTDATPGRPMCSEADKLSAEALGVSSRHRSALVTKEHAEISDLILTADRGHRAAIGRLAPQTRSRTFTLRQASRLATWVTSSSGTLAIAADRSRGIEPVGLDEHDPRLGVPALPTGPEDRFAWLVAELDAARGTSPVEVSTAGGPSWHPDDVDDPHVAGLHLHSTAVPVCLDAARDIVQAFHAVLAMP